MRTHPDVSELLARIEKLEKQLVSNNELSIPAEAFATDLTPLETVVVALREKHHLKNKKIASLLKRSASSISGAFSNAKKKQQQLPWPAQSRIQVPCETFSGDLAPGQALVVFLQDCLDSTSEVGRLIGRDPRNVDSMLKQAQRRGEDS